MKIKNSFYIFKDFDTQIPNSVYPGIRYDLSTGQQITDASGYSSIIKHSLSKSNRLLIHAEVDCQQIYALLWDSKDNFLGYDSIVYSSTYNIDYTVTNKKAFSIAFVFTDTSLTRWINIEEKLGYSVYPHYKNLKKVNKKENNQMFFRESLDGKITLFGTDYELINSASLEDNLIFNLYKNDSLFITASFNKSDCKFDHAKKCVELKLTYSDAYSKILDAYENTYDLIKLAPVLTPVQLTKRCVVQIYSQGERVLSNYAGGTYWETDVDEIIDDQNALINKYHFSRGPRFAEVNLNIFNYDQLNGVYKILNSDTWNCSNNDGCIFFRKAYSANQMVPNEIPSSQVHLISNDIQGGIYESEQSQSRFFRYDIYTIEMWSGHNATGAWLYQSSNYYALNSSFSSIAIGNNLYLMHKIDQPSPMKIPTPEAFYLGAYITENQIWGRLLCDVDVVPDGHGGYVNTYDLPYDDFATPRRNYRKCIGLTGFDSDTSEVQIVQNGNMSSSPTSYGITDYGQYFLPPYTLEGHYYYPLSRNAWTNTSMWVKLGYLSYDSFEAMCAQCYKRYWIKDTYNIGDAIKAILSKIDPTIKHEKTAEYSQFIYGHRGISNILITQKTNILKGEYDQAAQKAEITFKQIMEMLRDCFRCYWFIDSENRLRIEHVSYFMRGLDYDNPANIQFDLTQKKDKFNKKEALYCQQEIDYDKSNLTSRYEFAYSDDVTKVMGGDLYIDVKNKYIQKDKKEEINISGFTADIDYMLFLPDDFSQDGFALMIADDGNTVPIVKQEITDEKQFNRKFQAYVQNWYASFNHLAQYYMFDLSGTFIENNNIELIVQDVKKSMKHVVEIPLNENVDLYKLIKTEIGNGSIEEVSTDIDTNLTKIELRYNPV